MKFFLISVILMTLCSHANSKESITDKIQVLKQQAVLLHKDLAQLEQDLIYPSTTQVAIYLAKRLDKGLTLGSVELSVDGVITTHHVYTLDQNKALELGGMQRLHMGNFSAGEHVFRAVVKVVNSNNDVIIFKGEKGFYKDSKPLSLKINLFNDQDTKAPVLSLTRL